MSLILKYDRGFANVCLILDIIDFDSAKFYRFDLQLACPCWFCLQVMNFEEFKEDLCMPDLKPFNWKKATHLTQGRMFPTLPIVEIYKPNQMLGVFRSKRELGVRDHF